MTRIPLRKAVPRKLYSGQLQSLVGCRLGKGVVIDMHAQVVKLLLANIETARYEHEKDSNLKEEI